VRTAGTLHLAGFIRSGHDQGTLVLSNAHGSVNLKLTAKADAQQTSGSPDYQFTIVSGTGAFQGATGKGSATISYGGPLVALRRGSVRGSFVMALNEVFPASALPM
jgi:hypothetical protein